MNNKRILFLVDYWTPNPTANAVCVRNVAKTLHKKGWDIYVSAYNKVSFAKSIQDEGIHVSFILPPFARQLITKAQQEKRKNKAKIYNTIGLLLNRLRKIILLPLYPISSLTFSLRWSRRIEKQIHDMNISCIVSVNSPEETFYCSYLVKKRNPGIRWIVYNIDPGTNILSGTHFEKLKRFLQKKAVIWENRVLEIADGFIVMQGHSSYYEGKLNRVNIHKLKIADVPLFDMEIKEASSEHNPTTTTTTKRWVYTGNLSGKYYNPHMICEFFMKYRMTESIELHLYGPSDWYKYLDDLSKDPDSGIIWHGVIPHDQIHAELSKADVLVYFITQELDSVSGKLFEYLKYKKPIIYLGPKEDINTRHLKKYPAGLCLDMDGNVYENIKITNKFLRNSPHSNVTESSLKESFIMNMPEATASIINDIFTKTDMNAERTETS